ncbi:hypothetical protein [Streptomyces sp. NPDC018031]|uniref:hypothetical protein n=1 Tax=Streptomyces sp. NPDC018031 TaxID=3365033 RepID=UPI0037911541
MEHQQSTATLSGPPPQADVEPVDVEQAEAAIVEHYPRLVRLAYLVLPPGMPRDRRVLTAHGLVQRALPRHRSSGAVTGPPGQRMPDGPGPAGSGYAYVRLRVVRGALAAGRTRRFCRLPRRGQLPPLLPLVRGLRLLPRTGGADAVALDGALAGLSGPGRAAYALRAAERLPERAARAVLAAAGVTDPGAALAEAAAVRDPAGSRDASPLESPGFDPCVLQARPTDLLRRRQHGRAALVGAAALVVCGTLLGVPGEGWGPERAVVPAERPDPALVAATDPARLTRAEPGAWRSATRADFATWPARGGRTGDSALLRRALRTWARPGAQVQLSVTPGTPSGAPAGPPQLLYAGDVGQASVVVLYDGLRVVRYAEPSSGGPDSAGRRTGERRTARADGAGGPAAPDRTTGTTGTGSGTAGREGLDADGVGTGPRPAALDFARVDAGDEASATALVISRSADRVRYLTAPWVRTVRVRDLLAPQAAGKPLDRAADGVTAPVSSPVAREGGGCGSWAALQFGARLVTDLGEIVPARLTHGTPPAVHDVTGPQARARWAGSACRLASMASRGVRSVNTWRFATQPLPDGTGVADWVCTRAETWRGSGSSVLAQFRPAAAKPGTQGTVTATARDSAACGPRQPRVLSGVRWRSGAGQWFLLAAGSPEVVSIASGGEVRGAVLGHTLALPASAEVRPRLRARLSDGSRIRALG